MLMSEPLVVALDPSQTTAANMTCKPNGQKL